ncbi:MAG TPA: HD domain-containing phosphohydrolase [bacterium]|jgi:putative nucleotidyltransferase with HDIG domain
MHANFPLTTAIENRKNIFHPAPLATLRPGMGASFELYLGMPGRGGIRYLLYKAAEFEFTDKKRRELIENGVKTLYVRDEDASDYYTYVDRTVGQVLASDQMSPAEKSAVLYETSQSLIKSTFERPQSPLIMSANKKVVAHTVASITADPAMLRTMVSLFSFDYSLYSHSVHVSVLGTGLALETGTWTESEIRDIAMGFLLHDIGKCQVSADILRKPGMLSPWEIRQMEKHPELGVSLMAGHPNMRPEVIEIIRNHHERLDGSGYPRHLPSHAIPLESRICSVADVFDAFTSHRVYKPAMSGYEALKTILGKMAHELDDEIVHLLIHRLGPNATRIV